MAQKQINPGSPPVLWSDVASAYDSINDNFNELYATLLGGGGEVVEFTNLGTSLIPRTTELYDLGSNSKKWRDLWLSGSSIHLGDAIITSTGTTVNLPIGSTIGGLRVDENYFKFISVVGQDTIEADDGTDTLTLASGNSGITLTTDADTDTLIITNSGVTSITGTSGQIGVSENTGNIIITNLGVTSATAGQGIQLSSSTGSVTITNTGIINLDAGIGIQLSDRDPVTGVITITNSQPNIPQQTFSIVSVPTQTPLAADSTADTLNIEVSGNGLSITTAPLTDTLTFRNTGVTSLAVGNGLTIDAGTGAVNLTLDSTLNRNIVGTVTGDVTGSVFADNSSVMVDAIDNRLYAESFDGIAVRAYIVDSPTGTGLLQIKAGDVSDTGNVIFINPYGSNTFINSKAETHFWGTGPYNSTGNPYIDFKTAGAFEAHDGAYFVGNLTGDVIGSVFADDSTMLVDATDGKIVGDVVNTNINTTTIRPTSGVLVIDANGGTANIISGVNGGIYVTDTSVATAVQGDISLYSITSGQIDIGTQGTANGVNIGRAGITTTIYGTLNATITGDVIGSVFADDSTLLINGVDGTINASALTGALPAIDGSALTGVIAASIDWTDVANTPTTISGYGITDAYITGVDLDLSSNSLTGATNVTGSSGGTISQFTNITGDTGGTISQFTNITGDTGGTISQFTNITGDTGGTISGFTNITGDTGGTISQFTNITGDTGGTISGFTNITGDTGGSISGFSDITVTTVFAGTIDTSDSSAITVVPAVTFNTDVTVENELFVSNSITAANFLGNVTATSVVTSSITTSKVKESVSEKTGATGTVVHDLSTSSVFYHTSISANFTANFTNLNIAAGQGTNISLLLVQGGTAYIPNAVQIGGVAQTINWQDSSPPTGNTNKLDIVTFSIVRIGDTYTVFGALTSFGT